VFDVGWRGDEQRTPEVGSSSGGGLGLAIARGVVESHDGNIAVSNVDGGCAFQIDLPPVAAHN
jgi:signal transduction histidine kinase